VDETLLLGILFWIGGVVAGVAIGREKGRLAEGIVLTAILGVLGVILIAVLPPKSEAVGQKWGVPTRLLPPPIPKTDPAKGYMTCGCAVLCALGMPFLFFGIGFGGVGGYSPTDLLFFGSILSFPAAVCTYSGLTIFGVSDACAKMWGVVVFCLMFGATWLFLHEATAEYNRLRGR
jgi:hypothetical protein